MNTFYNLKANIIVSQSLDVEDHLDSGSKYKYTFLEVHQQNSIIFQMNKIILNLMKSIKGWKITVFTIDKLF